MEELKKTIKKLQTYLKTEKEPSSIKYLNYWLNFNQQQLKKLQYQNLSNKKLISLLIKNLKQKQTNKNYNSENFYKTLTFFTSTINY